ncbi:hypothetical protein COB57_00690 [Candidatus Peregrinibacteria bacterium]|nr:MAG: hypothetical protein COB57_00690 [Candidatus Peregrinibacteria bacterium]
MQFLPHDDSLIHENEEGNTPLHTCITEGSQNTQLLRLHIGAKENINAQNKKGNTPLHLAVIDEQKKMISTLVQSNARIDIKNKKGETPDSLAKEHSMEIQSILHLKDVIYDDGDGILHLFIREGSQKTSRISKYLTDGALINLQNDKGNTPLHLAVLDSQTTLITLFVKHGARLDITNNKGETVTDLANGNSEIELLLKK